MITTHARVMKLGNSNALIIPKIVMDNYKIKTGDELIIGLHEDGLIIPKPLQGSDVEVIIKEKYPVVLP